MLSGDEILKLVEEKKIKIKPFIKENINPNSYNFTLSDEIFTYENYYLDSKKQNNLVKQVIPEEGFVLQQNEVYIAYTNEFFKSGQYLFEVDGRSSIGRLGIYVHLDTGLIERNFKGRLKLTIKASVPIRIYKNMEIGQISIYKSI
ncbi:MAG: 2'-deoxycytidine 5'-triphosphate deaminase domain-containing protein [Bacilli bacterium]